MVVIVEVAVSRFPTPGVGCRATADATPTYNGQTENSVIPLEDGDAPMQ